MSAGVAKYLGLTLAPAAWAASTQLGQILPYVDCRQDMSWSGAAAFGAAVLAAAAAALSHGFTSGERGTTLFIGRLGFLVGIAIAFALVLQGAAAVLVDACER